MGLEALPGPGLVRGWMSIPAAPQGWGSGVGGWALEGVRVTWVQRSLGGNMETNQDPSTQVLTALRVCSCKNTSRSPVKINADKMILPKATAWGKNTRKREGK